MRIQLIITVAAVLMLTACGQSTADKLVELTDRTTQMISNAKSADEVQKLNLQYAAEVAEIYEQDPDFVPSEEENKEIMESAMRMSAATRDGLSKKR